MLRTGGNRLVGGFSDQLISWDIDNFNDRYRVEVNSTTDVAGVVDISVVPRYVVLLLMEVR